MVTEFSGGSYFARSGDFKKGSREHLQELNKIRNRVDKLEKELEDFDAMKGEISRKDLLDNFYLGCRINFTCTGCMPYYFNVSGCGGSRVICHLVKNKRGKFVHMRDMNYVDNQRNNSDKDQYVWNHLEPLEDNYGLRNGSDIHPKNVKLSINKLNFKKVIRSNTRFFLTKLNHYEERSKFAFSNRWAAQEFYPAHCLLCRELMLPHRLDEQDGILVCRKNHNPKFYYIDREMYELVKDWPYTHDYDGYEDNTNQEYIEALDYDFDQTQKPELAH